MEKELTLIEHLEELRRRIVVSAVLLLVVSAAAFPLTSKVLEILKSPSAGLIEKLVFFNPQEAFLIHIKASFFVGFIMSMPVILYQLWAFISPAIDESARSYGLVFLASSIIAFVFGALFGFYLLVPTALRFLLSFAGESLEPVISVSSYISFVIGLVIASGAVFEMPVLSFLLSKIGIINPRFLRKQWKYAVIIIFIIAALITPTADIFNMMLLALPMVFLYELSIWVSFLAGHKKRRPNEP